MTSQAQARNRAVEALKQRAREMGLGHAVVAASHQERPEEAPPSSKATKAELVKWLTDRKVAASMKSTKAELQAQVAAKNEKE